jgi:hypothetical protein
MDIIQVAAPWFFVGLAIGFLLSGLLGLILSRGL